MDSFGKAYFVQRPRTIYDLRFPHPVETQKPLQIVKTIHLSPIDYSNFIHDMLVDREFIEEWHSLCSQGDVWKCLFICGKNTREGIAVIPQDKCFVGWAAFYSL